MLTPASKLVHRSIDRLKAALYCVEEWLLLLLLLLLRRRRVRFGFPAAAEITLHTTYLLSLFALMGKAAAADRKEGRARVESAKAVVGHRRRRKDPDDTVD